MSVELGTPSPRSRLWREPPSPLGGKGKVAPILPLALILAVLLTAWWVWLDWADLGVLRLPDADAMLRLAQIRDWLDGQGFADLLQSRLGPPGGVAMQWSRLPDLVPALLIRLLSPVMGTTRAEIAAVVFWPELLFFLHLLLAGAMARRLGGAVTAAPAVALAALAWPAIALFMPGRIDHYGLQVVLAEAVMLDLLGRRLLIAGGCAGASLLVGIETAPVFAAAGLWLIWTWTEDRHEIAGFGAGLVGAGLVGAALFRPDMWPGDRCDGFTPPILTLMLIGGGALLLLAGFGSRLPNRRWRLAAAAAVLALALAAGWLLAPACFASSDSLGGSALSRSWPDQAARSPGSLIRALGLPLMGLGAAIAFAVLDAERRRSWMLIALALGVCVAAALIQLRALWFAAALAAPVLAQLVQMMRGRGIAWLIATWLLSAGLVWQTIGSFADGRDAQGAGCSDKNSLAALDRLDTGTFAAPMELSAYLIGRTQHRSLGGPYTRNARGNQALAELFLSPPEEARYQASLWTVDYIALCPTATGGLPPELLRPGGLGAHLLEGAAPDWLQPVSLIGSDTLVWRVRGIAGPGPRP